MDEKVILGSLALDLKRAAMGFYRRSIVTAERFLKEALKRKDELRKLNQDPYIFKLLAKLEKSMQSAEMTKKADDALMYSTLIQNYVLNKL